MTFTRRRAVQSLLAASLAAPGVGRAFAQSADPFRIGALNPVTGAGAPYGGGMQKMILAAAEAVNGAGGAGGRKFEVMAEDTQTTPQAAVLAAKKLIEVNKVQAILGTWSSGVSLAVIPLTNDANIFLFNTSGAPALSGPPVNAKGLSYRYQATNERFGRAFAQIAKKEGFKNVATMAFNNASGIGNTEGFRKAWEAMGHKVAASVVYEPNQPSYRAELQKVLAAKPDAIVTGSYLADTTIILREWYQLGEKTKWVIPGWAANPNLITALGNDVVEGIFSVDSVANEQAPSFKAFDEAYRRTMNQPGLDNIYAAMTWDMVNVLALAMEAAGPGADIAAINRKIREIANPEGTKVYSFAEGKEALKKGKINYEGASSVLDFDEFGDVSPDFGVYPIKAGKLERAYTVKI